MVTLGELINRLGGASAVAEARGIGASAVSNWVARGAVAAEHRLALWRMATEAGIDWTPPGAEGLVLMPRPAGTQDAEAAA